MELNKIKKYAKIFTIICLAVTAIFVVTYIVSIFPMFTQASGGIRLLISNLLLCVLTLLVMGNACRMLLGIAKDTSPFTAQNVRHLRVIGWSLIIFEPLQYLINVANPVHFMIGGEEYTLSSTSSFGGLFFIAGIAVICVSMIFRYGVELQIQADETL